MTDSIETELRLLLEKICFSRSEDQARWIKEGREYLKKYRDCHPGVAKQNCPRRLINQKEKRE